MPMNFKTLRVMLPIHILNRKPVMIRAPHGVGKSEFIYQIAKIAGNLVGEDHAELPVIEQRPSQMPDAGDVRGLPWKSADNSSTSWLPPDWFKRCCDEACVLLLDEFDRGQADVRMCLMELTDSRKINGRTLHPNTIIVACCNGGDTSSQYQVADLDPAELSRWAVIDFAPEVEEWLEWACAGNVQKPVTDFITAQKDHLEHKGDFEPGKVYPCRRSWTNFSRACERAKLFDDPKSNSGTIYNVGTAYVGFEASIAFVDFLKSYKTMVTAANIMDEGKFELLKDATITDLCGLCDRIKNDGYLAKDFTETQCDNFCGLFLRLPSEVGMKLFNEMQSNVNNLRAVNHNTRVVLDGQCAAHGASPATNKLLENITGTQKTAEAPAPAATTAAVVVPATTTAPVAKKRGRGRPKGSKNKPKTVAHAVEDYEPKIV